MMNLFNNLKLTRKGVVYMGDGESKLQIEGSPTLAIGDTVALNSGGPVMTVEAEAVLCRWAGINGDPAFHSGYFPVACLKKTPPTSG